MHAEEPCTDREGVPVIRIDTTRARETTIAIPDAMNLGPSDAYLVGATIQTTLRRDLELAGYFVVLLSQSFFFDQHADGMDTETINFANWQRITFEGTYNTTPDWSPDGYHIAYTGRDSRNRFDIFVIDLEGRLDTRCR